jgi:hypothetical protein
VSKNDEDYEPPHMPDSDLAQRLSLPTSSAQKEGKRSSLAKHRKKAGFVKKKGHLVKNWKKRYLVLKGSPSVTTTHLTITMADGTLTYFGGSNPSKQDEHGFDEGYPPSFTAN